MRRRIRPIILAATLAILMAALLAAPARAATAPPVNLGRKLVGINLESGASVQASVQGQLIDTNANGVRDSLRGRAAGLENHGVARLRIYYVQVQSDFADTWAPALTNQTDAVSSAQPAYVTSVTPSSRFCPPPGDFNLRYRVTMAIGIRSLDGSLAAFRIVSFVFEARAINAAQNDVC
jgi:hypothetical protein